MRCLGPGERRAIERPKIVENVLRGERKRSIPLLTNSPPPLSGFSEQILRTFHVTMRADIGPVDV